MYFCLHIHKRRRAIIRMALVSETTNIISCDAPTPQADLLNSDGIWNRVRVPR